VGIRRQTSSALPVKREAREKAASTPGRRSRTDRAGGEWLQDFQELKQILPLVRSQLNRMLLAIRRIAVLVAGEMVEHVVQRSGGVVVKVWSRLVDHA
jgi:hypothetical protein